MEYICVGIMKEKEKQIFDSRENAVQYFLYNFSDEIFQNGKKRKQILEEQSIEERRLMYIKKEKFQKIIWEENNEEILLLDMAGISSNCGRFEMIKEKYYLVTEVVEIKEDVLHIFEKLSKKFEKNIQSLFFIPKEKMIEVSKKVTNTRKDSIRNFKKNNFITEKISI